ncbi:MAG: GPW/gp25 family protein [Anaerolineaceae bacterium]|nr:GPW/gp25 family protein [Anaerolineaceae bacterium]
MPKEIVGKGWAFPPQISAQGGLALTNEQNELSQAIFIILSTPPGQRVMRPTFGCRLNELVFAPNNAQTAARARRYVTEALGMWEPRIRVIEVNIHPDDDRDNRLIIDIEYEIKATHDRRSLVHPFYLIPEEAA